MAASIQAVCGDSLLDLTSPCIRETWAALAPTAFVLLACLSAAPLPTTAQRILRVIGRPFGAFLPLSEAEALNSDGIGAEDIIKPAPPVPLWRTVILSLLALAETLGWLIIGSYRVAVQPGSLWDDLRPFVIAASWLFGTVRPVASPSATPPYDLFILYFFRLAFDTLNFGGALYDHTVEGQPLLSPWTLTGHAVNLTVIIILLTIILSMPLAIPSPAVNPEDVVRSSMIPPYGHCPDVAAGQVCLARGLYFSVGLDVLPLGQAARGPRNIRDLERG